MRKLLAGLLLLPALAGAWGRQGHMTVALVAEGLLTPQARQLVDQVRGAKGWQELLPGRSRGFDKADAELAEFCQGPEGRLELVADWADAYRFRHRGTAAWHFVDLPLAGDGGPDALRQVCPEGDCLPAQLTNHYQVLKDRTAAPLARLEALLWVVHLAGDIAQPLHAATDDDMGGNERGVFVMGRVGTLHGAWDTGFFVKMRARPAVLAAELDGGPWARGPVDPSAWAQESFRVAKSFVYPQFERTGGHYGAEDVRQAWPVVKDQLARGGGRLALMLNAAAGE